MSGGQLAGEIDAPHDVAEAVAGEVIEADATPGAVNPNQIRAKRIRNLCQDSELLTRVNAAQESFIDLVPVVADVFHDFTHAQVTGPREIPADLN